MKPIDPKEYLKAQAAQWEAFAKSEACQECGQRGGWHTIYKDGDAYKDCTRNPYRRAKR